jgi:hypothetical protein
VAIGEVRLGEYAAHVANVALRTTLDDSNAEVDLYEMSIKPMDGTNHRAAPSTQPGAMRLA